MHKKGAVYLKFDTQLTLTAVCGAKCRENSLMLVQIVG